MTQINDDDKIGVIRDLSSFFVIMMKGIGKIKKKIVGEEMANVKVQSSNQTKAMSKHKV
jgi:hypothetical protein